MHAARTIEMCVVSYAHEFKRYNSIVRSNALCFLTQCSVVRYMWCVCVYASMGIARRHDEQHFLIPPPPRHHHAHKVVCCRLGQRSMLGHTHETTHVIGRRCLLEFVCFHSILTAITIKSVRRTLAETVVDVVWSVCGCVLCPRNCLRGWLRRCACVCMLKHLLHYLADEANGDFVLVGQLNTSSRFVVFVWNENSRTGIGFQRVAQSHTQYNERGAAS